MLEDTEHLFTLIRKNNNKRIYMLGYYNTKNNTITLKNNVEIIENGITLIADEFKYFILILQ